MASTVPNSENTQFKTGEEQVKIAKQGGIASGEAKRRRKSMQEFAEMILGLSMKTGEVHSVEDIKSLAEIKDKNLTVDQMILLKQAEKAIKGDLSSATFIRDTSGNKPKEIIEHSGEVNNPYSKLSEEELRKLAE